MKKLGKIKRVLSGLLTAVTIMSSVIQPMSVYAEETKEMKLPELEIVKEQLSEDEIVKANDFTIEFGSDFDVKNDMKELEYDENKVKVTFYEAKSESGENFNTNQSNTYKSTYYVEPISGNPSYQISRIITVSEPIEAETEGIDTIVASTDDSDETINDSEESESKTEQKEDIPESEIQTGENEPESESETEVIDETEVKKADETFESELEAAQTQDTLDEESGLDLPEVLKQAGDQNIDLLEIENGDSVEFEAITTYASSSSGTKTVTITRGDWYYYSDYGLGSYLTSPFYVTYGDIKATAYCVQPSKSSPGSGTYSITKLSDGKNLAKVCYYATKASGEDGFFAQKYPDFSTGKKFVITHIAASYANGSSDAFEGTNSTGIALAKELYNYCLSMPDIPDVAMSFSDGDVKAYLDGSSQRTKTVKFKADAAQTITMKLPKGVQLVNETTGKTSKAGADVEISGGTSFYLKAPLSQVKDVAQTFSSTMKGSITKDFSAYKISTGGTTQDLAFVFGEGTVEEKYVDFKVTWIDLATVQVTKKDSENGNGIAGAVYGIYADKGCSNLIAQMPPTNNHGASALQIERTQDTVYVREISAPIGYLIDTNSYNVKLVSMATSNQDVLQKEVKGQIIVKKVDAETGKYEGQGDAKLTGAVYGLYAQNDIVHPDGHTGVVYKAGTLVADKTFGNEETIVFDNLHLGDYFVKEISAPEGYLMDMKEHPVTLSYENDKKEVITSTRTVNEQVKKQPFELIKISTDGSNTEAVTVQGAEFTVKLASEVAKIGWDEAKTYDVLTSDMTGYAKSIELPYGTYTVKETKTPADMNTIKDFTVVINEDSREPQSWRVFNDSPFKAYIRLIKKDAVTGNIVLLSDVSFKIKDMKTGNYVEQKVGNKKIDTFITDETGTITTPLQLAAGDYEVTEIKAPYGYTIRTEAVPLKVSTGGAIQVGADEDGDAVLDVVIENSPVTGSVNILKHGEQLNGLESEGIVASMVTFVKELIGAEENKNLIFEYEDAPLDGATFQLVVDDTIYTPDHQVDTDGNRLIAKYNGIELKKDAIVATLTTDADGKASLEQLPLGKYHLEETIAGDGYVRNPKIDSFELTYENQEVAVVTHESEYENQRVHTKVTVNKTCEKTKKPVKGAVYGIYNTEDIQTNTGEVVVEKDTLIEQQTTDEKGSITFEADLPLGKYYVKELEAAPGYLLNEELYEVDLTYKDQEVNVITSVIAVTDEPITVEIRKTDITTGEEIEGAHMQVIDAEGNVFEEWVSAKEPHIIYGIPTGDYTLVETQAPTKDGYVKAVDVPFTVSETGEVQQVEMKDDYTKVEISKTDITGEQELPGAALTILDENDKVVESWVSTEEPHYIEKLPVGTYTLREESAPKGYIIVNDVTFEVAETAEIQKVAMKDDTAKGKIIIDKKDKDSEEPIKGVEFELRDEKGKVLETLKTDSAGHAESDLYEIATYKNGVFDQPIKYYLVETKAADGYKLDDTKYEITFEYVDDHTPVIEVLKELTNEKTPEKDTPQENSDTPSSSSGNPKTGDETNLWIPLLAMGVSVAGIAGILIRRKRKTIK